MRLKALSIVLLFFSTTIFAQLNMCLNPNGPCGGDQGGGGYSNSPSIPGHGNYPIELPKNKKKRNPSVRNGGNTDPNEVKRRLYQEELEEKRKAERAAAAAARPFDMHIKTHCSDHSNIQGIRAGSSESYCKFYTHEQKIIDRRHALQPTYDNLERTEIEFVSDPHNFQKGARFTHALREHQERIEYYYDINRYEFEERSGIEHEVDCSPSLCVAYSTVNSFDAFTQSHQLVKISRRAVDLTHEAFLDQNHEDMRIYGNFAIQVIDAITNFIPGISFGRDLYEAVVGKNLFTQEELNSFERTLAVMGVASFGFPSVGFKAFQKLERVIGNSDVVNTAAKILEPQKLRWEKSLSELKETLRFFKRHKFWKQTDEQFFNFSNAFMKGAETRILTEDMKVYRYYDPKYSKPKGNWVTPHKVNNPEMDLALPHSGNYIAIEYTIPKGTEVLEGIVAPNWGKTGGAWQIFVPNLEVLQ